VLEENYYNLKEFTPLPAASYQYPLVKEYQICSSSA